MTNRYKIHPAIGIARVGDSEDGFYLAPEGPGELPIACDQCGISKIGAEGEEQRVSTFRDVNGHMLRQGARFRIYEHDENGGSGRELKIGDKLEVVNPKSGQLICGDLLDIEWTVHVANKKSAWYEFQQLEGEHGYKANHPLRNKDISGGARQNLIIDPGPRTVNYVSQKNRRATFSNEDDQEAYPKSFDVL